MEFADLRALEIVLKTLDPLLPEERERVLRWTIEKLKIVGLSTMPSKTTSPHLRQNPVDTAFERHSSGFQSIGDFVAAAKPNTDADRVLAVAVYLQDFAEDTTRSLTGKEINDELKHLGHGVKNITDCINTLKARSPQHMIQTRKGGSVKQAWKEYRVTRAGLDHIYRLIGQGEGNEEA